MLRDRTFLLLQGRTTSVSIGYWVYLATVLWLSYRLTGGIVLAGVLVGVETAVYTATFLVGPIVDRIPDKRWVYVLCYPVQAFASVVLGVTYALGILHIPLLVGLVVVLAVLWDFTWAADQAATRLLFGSDRLFAVSGLGTALGGAVDVAMYLGVGATIALFGAAGGSYLYAALLAAGALFAVLLPIRPTRTGRGDYLGSFREGWDVYRGEAGRPLRHLAIVQLVGGFFTAGPLLLLTLTVARDFGGSRPAYAAMFVAYLVGGILIGIILGVLNPRRHVGRWAILSTAALGGAVLLAQFSAGSLVASFGAWAAVGLLWTLRQSAYAAYLQGRFAPELLARISGNSYVFPGVASALGAFVVAGLSTAWTPSELGLLVAAGFVGSAVVGAALPGARGLGY